MTTWVPTTEQQFAPPPAAKRTPEPWVSDVLVPGGQAALVAVPVTVVVFMGVLPFLDGDVLARLGPAFGASIVAGCMAFLFVVLATVNKRQALWFAESVTGVDLDQNGHVGPPPRERPIIVRQHVPAPPAPEPEPPPAVDAAADFAAFVTEAQDRGLTRPAWLKTGEKRYILPSGARVTRRVYQHYADILKEAGLAADDGAGLAFVGDVDLAGWMDTWLAGDGVASSAPAGE